MKTNEEKNSDPSLKAIDILESLRGSGKDGLGITEIAEIAGLHKSSVHRIITALAKREYVIRNEATKKYVLGYKLLELCAHLVENVPLKDIARPYLEALNDRVQETIHLIQRDGNYCVIIDKLNCKHSIGLLSYVGKRQLLHCTSAGKIIMAFMEKEDRNRVITEGGLIPITGNTIVDPAKLEREIMNIREQGISWNISEDREDVVGIATPIFDAAGKVVAALNVSGPSFRFTQEIAQEAMGPLKETAAEISRKMGYRQS
ncbi:MAG: IclR family transcriptional regulator [Paenibacillus sp.]|jgi:IclR family acetate operon transcriptional repressor|nr:IclR family transcriptional regulator [Paenibacillus sp.]